MLWEQVQGPPIIHKLVRPMSVSSAVEGWNQYLHFFTLNGTYLYNEVETPTREEKTGRKFIKSIHYKGHHDRKKTESNS